MSYFSRLTDIVTCSLTRLLSEADDPHAAIKEIVAEMEEGLAGAKRSVATATTNAAKLKEELSEHKKRIDHWTAKAKQELTDGNDNQARLALIRKKEIDDLVAGLQQQYAAAIATQEHLMTTQRALEARLAEAQRKQKEMDAQSDGDGLADTAAADSSEDTATIDDARAQQIDEELEALRRELGDS